MEQKAIQRCNTDYFTGMKEETNLQNEPLSMKNETARLKQIITDCLICRISKILLQAYRQKKQSPFQSGWYCKFAFYSIPPF